MDPLLIGNYHSGTIIRPFTELPEYLRDNTVDLAIIATPKEATQKVADVLVAGGVKSIWNFAPDSSCGTPTMCRWKTSI